MSVFPNTGAVRRRLNAADLLQPVSGDDGDSFGQRAQELDGPAHLVGHQAGHVGDALRHAASQTSQHLLPRLVHHACEQNLVGGNAQLVRFKQLKFTWDKKFLQRFSFLRS